MRNDQAFDSLEPKPLAYFSSVFGLEEKSRFDECQTNKEDEFENSNQSPSVCFPLPSVQTDQHLPPGLIKKNRQSRWMKALTLTAHRPRNPMLTTTKASVLLKNVFLYPFVIIILRVGYRCSISVIGGNIIIIFWN